MMDSFFLLLGITLVPVLAVFILYAGLCLVLPGQALWRRFLPLLPILFFLAYAAAARLSAPGGDITVPTLLLMLTVLSLLAVPLAMFRGHNPPLQFLSFSSAILGLLLIFFVFGAAQAEFQRNRAASPLRLLQGDETLLR